ncbi:MAG TPA: c-type cytochrome biogenesis protein CcmI [Candidatus Binataceae bacterium]|nr:c-type cytochrome biogenesis protein CcmI [Candidatus Binataceae bacterium]
MAFYVAAFLIVMGVALFVAAPLSGGLVGAKKRTREELERDHWDHEHALAVQGLRELEFDREMGKLSDADYESLRASLQNRALQAMTAIDKFKDQERIAKETEQAAKVAAVTVRPKLREAAAIANEIAAMSKPKPAIPTAPGMAPSIASPAASSQPRSVAGEIGGARRVRFCPQCGTRTAVSANFCGECGASLRGERVATRAS